LTEIWQFDYNVSYDNLGRVTAIDAGVERVKFTYTYHPNTNNIAAKTFHHRSPVVADSYAYDALDRLTDVEYLDNPSDVEVFPMDDLGNRVGSVTQRDGVHTYTVDSLTNRYTQIDSAAIGHDDAGSLVQDRQGYRYQYDYENRIVRIYKLAGQSEVTVATFDYDALGRRIRKVDPIAEATTLYYYDPEWRCLEERDGSGALQARYVYGNYIDETLLMDRLGTEYYYLHDHLYSPVALLDTGAVVERYEYDAYGTVHVFDSVWNFRTASVYGNPYTFTARRLDVLDFGNLAIMYYRHRYYEPYVGRFFQIDPWGIDPCSFRWNVFGGLHRGIIGESLYLYRVSASGDPYGLMPLVLPPSLYETIIRVHIEVEKQAIINSAKKYAKNSQHSWGWSNQCADQNENLREHILQEIAPLYWTLSIEGRSRWGLLIPEYGRFAGFGFPGNHSVLYVEPRAEASRYGFCAFTLDVYRNIAWSILCKCGIEKALIISTPIRFENKYPYEQGESFVPYVWILIREACGF